MQSTPPLRDARPHRGHRGEALRAELPCGRFVATPGAWSIENPTLADELEDVLFGPLAPQSGVGRVEMDGLRGRYRVTRDLNTGAVRIDTLRGRPAPPSPVMSPGFFLLGRERRAPTPERQDRTDDLNDRIRILEARARRLARTPARQDASPNASSDEDWNELERAVKLAFDREADTVDASLARNRELAACVRELSRPAEVARHLAAVKELETLAEDVARHRSEDPAPPSARAPEGVLLSVVGLAGLALTATGALLSDVLLSAAGIAAPAVLAVRWTLARRRTLRQRARRNARETALYDRYLAACRRAHCIPEDTLADPIALQALIERIRARHLLGGLKTRLLGLVSPRAARGPAERRLEILRRGVPDEIREPLAALAGHEPLLALPGLLDRARQSARADAGSAAWKRGFAAARAAEARRVDRELARLNRARRAAHLLRNTPHAMAPGTGWRRDVACGLVALVPGSPDLPRLMMRAPSSAAEGSG